MLSADKNLRDTRDLTYLLCELGLDNVVDFGKRQRFGGRSEHEYGRIRRIHLAVSRRARQIFRQLPTGGVDGRLHVVRGRVDVAVEVELDGNHGRAQRTYRGHLRDA